ncbi:MAG: hypothetical protein IH874_01250 [Candidatus Dadabacteria bacterium]|nr:hypothetical protein [Candidatus Dadabacteria bacterium]
MDWGLYFPSHIQSWQWVSHGESRGFSYFMPYDSIGSDVYETLALCAHNTKTIKLDPTLVISHTLPLEETPKGYELMDGRTANAIKVVLSP